MKTAFSLLVFAVLVGCGSRDGASRRSTLAGKNGSANARAASSAPGSSGSTTEPPQSQTQESELWDPNDELHVADKMLERVKREGVVRIVSVRASDTRYAFVGEFEETWQFAPTQPPKPRTDLWVVDKNGAGLQRLTESRAVTGLTRLTDDRESYDPEWSPSGDRIAFVNSGSVCVMEVRSKGSEGIKNVFDAQKPSDERSDASYVEFAQPKWSANGKGIAVLAKDGTTSWVIVANKDGTDICAFHGGFERYEWNSESEMVVDYGRFVIDWENLFSEGSNPRDAKTQDEKQQVPAQFLTRLLEKASAYGVERIADYSFDPSGKRIVFAGEFGTRMVYGSGSEADLWLVNRDGAGLSRLTDNQRSSQPAWSPSGKEIAFVADMDSISVINVKTRNVRSLPGLQAYHPKEGERNHDNWDRPYLGPQWSPNGKVIAAEGENDADGFVTVVDARFGRETLDVFHGNFSWSHDGALVIPAIGKFVFDWNSALFKRH